MNKKFDFAILFLMCIVAISTLNAQDFGRELSVQYPRIFGDDVLFIQKWLLERGFESVGEADGYYGPKTESAVKDLQDALGMISNGILRADLWKMILNVNNYPYDENSSDNFLSPEYAYIQDSQGNRIYLFTEMNSFLNVNNSWSESDRTVHRYYAHYENQFDDIILQSDTTITDQEEIISTIIVDDVDWSSAAGIKINDSYRDILSKHGIEDHSFINEDGYREISYIYFFSNLQAYDSMWLSDVILRYYLDSNGIVKVIILEAYYPF